MDANAFRHFYAYHFSENRKLWDTCIAALPYAQFVQRVDYSVGSVRNEIIHMVRTDKNWFSDLQGVAVTDQFEVADYDDRETLRAYWDGVEQMMRAYLAELRDDMLFQKPIAEGEDKDLILWQILLHVANHGTDHRAQVLRMLHDLGVKTESQDYIFYVYANP